MQYASAEKKLVNHIHGQRQEEINVLKDSWRFPERDGFNPQGDVVPVLEDHLEMQIKARTAHLSQATRFDAEEV